MNFFKSKKIVTVFLAVIIVSAISTIVFLRYNKGDGIVRAGVGDNVTGFAWSELYGWISFNSNDCDVNKNGYIDSGACGGADNNTTPVKEYGTRIDVNSGKVTGYAWNPLLGYICIGNAADSAIGKGCSSASTTPQGAAPYATYNRNGGNLSGWANVLSLGDNGWFSFNCADKGVCGTSNYVVNINAGTGIATGYAWNGNTDGSGVGWISFNCGDPGAGDCATSNYAVTANVNRPPNLSNLTAPNYDVAHNNDPCLDGETVKTAVIDWDFNDDDAQTSYTIVVKKHSNGSVVGTYSDNTSVSSGEVTGLAYGTQYDYDLTVFDSGNPKLSTSTTGSFTTGANEYPDVSFSWYAPNASAEEEIMFTAISKYYTGGTAHDCGALCALKWKTTDNADVISTSTASSTLITFATKGTSDEVRFAATSTDGILSCSTSTTMTVSEKLPNWKER